MEQEPVIWCFDYIVHLPFALIFDEDSSSIGPVNRLQEGAFLKGKAVDDRAESRLSAQSSNALPFKEAPSWSLLTGPMDDESSSKIRAKGKWTK